MIRVKKVCGQVINITSVLKLVKKRLRIHKTEQIFAIEIPQNKSISGKLRICSDMHLALAHESRFGGDGDIPVQNDEGELDDVSARIRDHDSHFSILVSNVSGGLGNGLSTDKKMAIKAMSIHDTVLAFSESNCVRDDARQLASEFGRDCRISALDSWTYDKKGARVRPSGARKLSAFGTAIISKDADLCEWPEVSSVTGTDFELIPVIMKRGSVTGLLLSGYRSPSMRDSSEIMCFFLEVDHIIGTLKRSHKLDFIIYAMDDNKCASEEANQLMQTTLKRHDMVNIIGNQPTRLGRKFGNKTNRKGKKMKDQRSTQPDTVWCWQDCFKTRVHATVIGKMTEKMDHSAIRLKVELFGIPPRKPVYREVTRKVKVKNDEDIEVELTRLLDMFCERYSPQLKSDLTSDLITDNASEEFYDLIETVKNTVSVIKRYVYLIACGIKTINGQ